MGIGQQAWQCCGAVLAKSQLFSNIVLLFVHHPCLLGPQFLGSTAIDTHKYVVNIHIVSTSCLWYVLHMRVIHLSKQHGSHGVARCACEETRFCLQGLLDKVVI